MENDNACVEDMILVMQESVVTSCRSFYVPAEISALHKVGKKIATYECFLQKFEQRCSEFLIF